MRLLDYDPFTGLKTYFKHDPATGKNIIKYEQDIQPFIDRNKFEAENLDKKKNWWKVGEIPNSVIIQWSTECGHPAYSKEWQTYAKKQMNSSEYRKLNPNKIRI